MVPGLGCPISDALDPDRGGKIPAARFSLKSNARSAYIAGT
jgi:hypothetical protein